MGTKLKTEAKPNGVAKQRSSTTYPYYGLTKVIEIVEAVRRAGGNDDAPAADVLRELGGRVTKTDRIWAYGIPASIYFGLVERIGRGDEARIKLTPLGHRMALPGTDDEHRATKIAAFKSPDLYSKLLEKFAGHPVPSKEVLKNILVRDYKIVESMAANAADAFLASLEVAELVSPTNTILLNNAKPVLEDKSSKANESREVKPETRTISVPADFIVYKCKISEGRVIEIPLPSKFNQADAQRLFNFLKTQVDDADAEE